MEPVLEQGRVAVGRGQGVAALFNGRAKQVTPAVVRAFRRALPDALVLVSGDLDQASRHVQSIAQAGPQVVFSGGGDGAAMRLLNLLRQALPDATPFPALGVLSLGTGNAWARTVGLGGYFRTVSKLPEARWPMPTRRFDLVEVEGTVCPFAGVGWDARLLNDYQRNLDRRSGDIFASRITTRLNKGLIGYLYSVARYTVPEQITQERSGGALVRLEALEGDAFGLDAGGRVVRIAGPLLHQGPVSVAAAATIPEWGCGFRAFPHATAVPGLLNIRIYDRPVLEAVRNAGRLWAGAHPLPGMYDFFVKRARMTFSAPVPFQIGGDAHGQRTEIEFGVSDRPVDVVAGI
jgi:diacylglycerol kinase family enzyme